MDIGFLFDYVRNNVPFVLTAGQHGPKWSAQRLIEALLISVCSGVASFYATQQVIETKLAFLQQQVSEIKQSVEHDRDRFQDQVDRLREQLERRRNRAIE